MHKDEHSSDAKEILRKRILDERRAFANPEKATISQDEPLDPAFPLFLSFKANDSIESVSDGILGKNTKMSPESHQADVLSFESNQKSNSIGTLYTETGTPIFKPYAVSEDETDDLYSDVPASASTNNELLTNSSSQTATMSNPLPNTKRLHAKRSGLSSHPGNANSVLPHIVRSKRTRSKCQRLLLFLILCISILVSIIIFLINFDVASLLNSLFS